MEWKKEDLDLVLVPSGVLIWVGYHFFLLCRYIRCPSNTIIGYEDNCRKIWVSKVMQADLDKRDAALTVISNNITASTFMASTSLAVTSLIATWAGSSSSQSTMTRFIYGSTSETTTCIKFITIQICFWFAFGAFVQSARCSVNANFFTSMPQTYVPEQYVADSVSQGNLFWHIGLRFIYFASILFMWVFGPIPLFISCLTMVVSLYILDKNNTPFSEFQQKTKHSTSKKIGLELNYAQ